MQAQTLLEALAARGARLTVRGDVLNVAPASVLDDLLCQSICEHKLALLSILAEATLDAHEEAAPPDFDAGAAYDSDLATAYAYELFDQGLATDEQQDNLLHYAEAVRAQHNPPPGRDPPLPLPVQQPALFDMTPAPSYAL